LFSIQPTDETWHIPDMGARVGIVGIVGIVVGASSCGGKPPTPNRSLGNTTVPTPSCSDAGTILRGDIGTADDTAGRAREAAIANACEIDRWAPEVVTCVTGTAKPQACLDKLTKAQHASYDAKLVAWSEQYGGAGYGGDSYGGDDYGGVIGGVAGGSYPHDCVVADAATYPPALGGTGIDREWSSALRKPVVMKACEDGNWSNEVRDCLATATDTTTVSGCLAKLTDQAQRDDLAKQLAKTDALAAKTATARKKTSSIDCKKVVAAHYADAIWKDKLPSVTDAKERKKAIADSRDLMTKACTTGKWPDTLRACVVAGGNDECFEAANASSASWGFPAAGVMVASGIAECDALGAEILRLSKCNTMPQATREAMLKAYQQSASAWANIPVDQRPTVASACKSSLDMLHDAAKTLCPGP
jgi:hypothetical protein